VKRCFANTYAMKKLLLLFLLSPIFTIAQNSQVGNDITIYSEDGLKFYLYVFSKQVNDTAQSNVTIKNLDEDCLDVKIVFEDTLHESIREKYLYISDDLYKPMSSVYVIGKWENPLVGKRKKRKQEEPISLYLHSRSNKYMQYNTIKVLAPGTHHE
jgi:hypothetical protein